MEYAIEYNFLDSIRFHKEDLDGIDYLLLMDEKAYSSSYFVTSEGLQEKKGEGGSSSVIFSHLGAGKEKEKRKKPLSSVNFE